jgi:outer membrane protein OmpA-like peptidoglycan-associated protein
VIEYRIPFLTNGEVMKNSNLLRFALVGAYLFCSSNLAFAEDMGEEKPMLITKQYREEQRPKELKKLQETYSWWPTDAQPSIQKDADRGGYWWYPETPGPASRNGLWGNRGYIYVYRIIEDYKGEDYAEPAPVAAPQAAPVQPEMRPSLLVRKVIKNVKVYFDYNKSDLRTDAKVILDDGLRILSKNAKASVLITGNADVRGSEQYNDKLAKARAASVQSYMSANGISADRIRLVSRGKLDAVAKVTDLVGMQKDRNAQFVVAEVEEVMMPHQGPPQGVESVQVQENVYLTQEQTSIESAVKVSTREYVVKEGDSLARIAQREMGSQHRWQYLYDFNKDRIKNPDKLRPGQKILIPVE